VVGFEIVCVAPTSLLPFVLSNHYVLESAQRVVVLLLVVVDTIEDWKSLWVLQVEQEQ
jgi:hypothetical protein